MGSQRASWQIESERNCWLWSQSVGAECQQFTYLDQLTWTVNPRVSMITQNGNCFQNNNNNKTWKTLGKGYMHLFASRLNWTHSWIDTFLETCPTCRTHWSFLLTEAWLLLCFPPFQHRKVPLAISEDQALISIYSENNNGKRPLICRCLAGVFQDKPTKPGYIAIVDGKVVGHCPKILGPNLDLTLEQLIYKTVSLIVLVTAQRVQSLHLPNMTETKKADSCVLFRLGQIKQRRPRNTGFEVGVHKWPENPYIFPHETSAKTQLIRVRCSGQVLISFIKPYRPVSKITEARWIKTMLENTGIDVGVFSDESTRAASISSSGASGVGQT